ncbi:LOW QUALITY PROTEIN: hypothetical protein PHMEG_0008145 [Phytophthora megakarya]|uniref:Uncharacterized protein n=1 Tax=Phytophthora megakarya TaxID=4795 RepID=A0A225WL61_9STRA|nr:LOW QUALITY PROTEIN: hypothetical protein PHMEG_0008145 [Phytophthora megakarya]
MMPDPTVPRSFDHTPSSPMLRQNNPLRPKALAQTQSHLRSYSASTNTTRSTIGVTPRARRATSHVGATLRFRLGQDLRHVLGERSWRPAKAASTTLRTSQLGLRPQRVDRQLHTPNPFPERFQSLGDAAPLPSRYVDELSEPDVITNDLDAAQGCQLTAGASSRSHRPVTHRYLQRRDATITSSVYLQHKASDPLDTNRCEPPAVTTDDVAQRQSLRERFLTAQVTTPVQYLGYLRQLLNREPVPAKRTALMVLAEGDTTNAYEAQFQNWVERSRRLNSYDALRARFSETIETTIVGTTSPTLRGSLAATSHAPDNEPAVTATGQSLSSAHDLSSPHSSGPAGDSVARPRGAPTSGAPDHKRLRREGSPAGVAPRTPTRCASEGSLATLSGTGYGPGDGVAPSGVQLDSGARSAHRAGPEEDERPLDPRAASVDALHSLQTCVGSVKEHLHHIGRATHRLVVVLEEIEHRVDWLALQQRVSDLERHVPHLQGQLDMLVRMQYPVALPPAIMQLPVLPHAAAVQLPVLPHPAAQMLAASQHPSDSALAHQSSQEQGPGMG